jgi:surfeit locus 1 family protein
VRRLVTPFLTTLALLCLTIGLGIWQLHRLAWKTHLLAQIDAAERSPAIPLPAVPTPFQKIVVQGRLDAARAVSYADDVRDDAHGNPVMGTYLVEPLLRPGQPPILVDLGWTRYPPAPVVGAVSVTGYVRPAEHPGWLSAKDDPVRRRFYTLDPMRIALATGLPTPTPYLVVALGGAGTPEPSHSLPRPPNDHLEYAITWFSLGLIALVMFLVWARGAWARGALRR